MVMVMVMTKCRKTRHHVLSGAQCPLRPLLVVSIEWNPNCKLRPSFPVHVFILATPLQQFQQQRGCHCLHCVQWFWPHSKPSTRPAIQAACEDEGCHTKNWIFSDFDFTNRSPVPENQQPVSSYIVVQTMQLDITQRRDYRCHNTHSSPQCSLNNSTLQRQNSHGLRSLLP